MGILNDDAASETIDESVESYDENPLTTNSGTWIDWKALVAVGSGVFSAAFFQGLAEFIRGLFRTFVINPAQAVADAVNVLLGGLFGTVPASISGSFRAAGQWVEGLGSFAFIGALALVLFTAFVVARGLNRE